MDNSYIITLILTVALVIFFLDLIQTYEALYKISFQP